MEKFSTLDRSVKMIAILGRWPQTAKQEGDKIGKTFLCNIWKKSNECPMLEVSLVRVGKVLSLERDAWSMVE